MVTNNVIVLEKDIYIATIYVNISKHGMKAFQPLHLQKAFEKLMFLNILIRTGSFFFPHMILISFLIEYLAC